MSNPKKQIWLLTRLSRDKEERRAAGGASGDAGRTGDPNRPRLMDTVRPL